MNQNEEMQLSIHFTPEDSAEATTIAAELTRGLGEMAAVQLTSQGRSEPVKRGLDAETIIQIINLSITGIKAIIQLAKLLMGITKKKSNKLLTLTNPTTHKSVTLLESDSFEKIEKKLLKLLNKEK